MFFATLLPGSARLSTQLCLSRSSRRPDATTQPLEAGALVAVPPLPESDGTIPATGSWSPGPHRPAPAPAFAQTIPLDGSAVGDAAWLATSGPPANATAGEAAVCRPPD